MKKYFITFFSLLSISIFSQANTDKVWDLLLKNKRTEARTLFDKTLASKAETDIDAMILDGVLQVESGQLFFDDAFVKKFVKISPDKAYIYPMIKYPFMISNTSDMGYDDYTFKKADVLADSKYNTETSVQYLKILMDHGRKRYEDVKKDLDKVGYIPNWQLCGVFENLNGSGLDIEYEPEKYAKSDKLFDANSYGKVSWYPAKNSVQKGALYFTNEMEYLPGIIYSQVFIESPREQEVLLELSEDSHFKVFLHDTEIYSTANEGINEYGSKLIKMKLYPGFNRLLIKSELSPIAVGIIPVISDLDYKKIEDLKFHDTFQDYHKKSFSETGFQLMEPRFEKFFKNKLKENPQDLSSKLLLLKGFVSISNNTEAKKIFDELLLQYPNSSYLNILYAEYNKNIGETEKTNEILKNMEIIDPGYFMNLYNKMSEPNFFENATVSDLEKYRDQAAATNSKILKNAYDMFISFKKSDFSSLTNHLDNFINQTNNNMLFKVSFAGLYDFQKSDKISATSLLEDILKERNDYGAYSMLIQNYGAENKFEDQKRLFKEMLAAYPEYSSEIRTELIYQLILDNKLQEALVETESSLDSFPYSAKMLANKGIIYSNQKKNKEAEKFLKESLSHNPSNSEVSKTLASITSTKDEINNVAIKDPYQYIKEKRKSGITGEKGVTKLLDEYVENVFADGGGKKRVTYIFEITSEKGVEEMKEYEVGYENTIMKSEIVKTNGSIVPAEEDYGYLVFPNLAVGDVILIQYENLYRSSGRFYKDFSLTNYFNTYYPVLESTFSLITPVNKTFATETFNGKIASSTKQIDDKKYTTWTLKNLQPLAEPENYSPNFGDLATIVKVNSFSSWSDISNWYSDLVKKAVIQDDVTKNTFNQIFPNGVTGLSQEKIAEKIYNYIGEHIKYSSVDFRQSGFVPQKPSKTVLTKLGDCKDLSTLFMVLGNYAGLKSNLVLVSTNDNAKNDIVLPSMGFNHCIIRTVLDGKTTFLELTDNYLPFKSVSRGTYEAKALVIGDKEENSQSKIIEIPYDNSVYPSSKLMTKAQIAENEISYTTNYQVGGEMKGFYYEIFKNNKEDARKNKFEESLGQALNKVVKIKANNAVSGNDLTQNPMVFEIHYAVAEKPQNVGTLKIAGIPFQTKPFTKELIALETRKTDIQYIFYENAKIYDEEIVMIFPQGSKVEEIPTNKSINYKGHYYDLKFEKVSENQLKIHRKADVSWKNIKAAEYPEFKKIVEEIIHAENQVIGYR